jgi:hypothetical protein
MILPNVRKDIEYDITEENMELLVIYIFKFFLKVLIIVSNII